MGMFDKLKNKVTANNDYDEVYDDNYYTGFDQPFDDQPQPQPEQNMGYDQQGYGMGQQMNMNTQPMSNPAPVNSGISMSGSAIELKVVKPTEFKNASQIADHLLNRRTVVLNLEATDKENARRLIDFLTGVAYSIDGQIKRVANNAYVITPNNVDISGDQMRRPQQAQQPQPQTQQPAQSEEYYSDLA